MFRFFLGCFKSYKISPIEDKPVEDKIYGLTVAKYWFWAAQAGSDHNLKDVLHKITNIDETDEDGNTALHLAAQHNHIRVIKFLLDKGCNPNICNRLGEKPKGLLKTEADSNTIITENDPMKLTSAKFSRPECFTDWDIHNGVEAKKLFELYEMKLTGDTLEIM